MLYISLCFIITAIFLTQLYSTITSRFFEMDLWWMIPSLFYYTEGKSTIEIIKFIFGVEPYMLGLPPVKAFLFFVSRFLGPQPKNYIFILLIFHFLNAILLFLLSKRLKLEFRIGLFAALIYLTLYAHFESYMWPFNIQHLIVVFFILLVLNLYFKTNELMDNNERYYSSWILTLSVNFAATFARMGIFILPATILVNILFNSKNDEERIKKYDMWMPLFIFYLIYPLITLVYVGDDQAEVFLRIKSIPLILNWFIFFVIGVLCLIMSRFFIKNYLTYLMQRINWKVLLFAFSGIYIVLVLKDIRNLILPYNIMVPFSAFLTSFFNPLQGVLLLDSTEGSYQIHSQMSPFGFFLGIIFIGVFLKRFVSENRRLNIIIVWYLIPLGYLNLYSNILSRYMVYITPLICLIVSSVVLFVYDYIMAKIHLKKIFKEAILILIFIVLIVPNIMAIKLELLRHKMASSFYLYDYIRIANIIKNDIANDKKYPEGKNKIVYISNVKAMPFKELWSFVPLAPENPYNFKFILAQVIDTVPIDNFKINVNPAKSGNGLHYFIQNEKVINSSGEDIDAFNRLFAEGVREFRNKNHKSAELLFEKAVNMRPFFINYILLNYAIEDSIWLTNGKDIRSWINKIINHAGILPNQSGRTEKTLYIKSIIDKEISIYIQSIFYLSYLNYALGELENSKYWFSKITYLITNPEEVIYLLGHVSEIKSNEDAMVFLKGFADPATSVPFVWGKPSRDRVPTNFQLFTLKLFLDGKVNEVIDNKANLYMQVYRHKRAKLPSMPGAL